MSENIHIYHTNDLHSHFENWPRIESFLKKRKQLHHDAGEECLIMDIGDHVDRWHPFTEGTMGKGNVELLNEAGYQYAAIGNNEGITLPHNDLDSLYESASFKVLAANIYDKNGDRPSWAKPYSIHTTKMGTKIALIGLTAYFQKFYSALGWDITDPYEELKKQLDEIKDKAHVIVLLSHLGIHDDERIAEEHPEIDVILGAHTHHVLHEGKIIKNTLLCGGGKFGYYVGQADLAVSDDRRVVRKTARLYDTNTLPADLLESSYIEEINKKGESLLQEKCVTLPYPLENKWFEASSLSLILCESLKEWTKADCAFINAGLLLDGLPAGDVTKGDIHRICPHPINPCIAELSGSELKEILMQSMNEEWPHIQVKGFGFRGKMMGIMLYEGIEFTSPKEIMINGEKLNPAGRYRLALPDMFTFGYFFPHLKRTEHKEYLLPEFMRDILEWKLKKMFPLT
ncbi:bifunctional UDP-sugar hydrolase/5'-nucleotidase [Bacillus sp. MUM 13]|uniref:bifunctional metallophosphatase/5'-nucleotidase n=1 Tax=Bacillus sp. MUM 13 TaxID=1678001 RepID=UPI0008F5C654|nr:bifunctional UDP-sugar hydrolase/5'-nucleotidase [Bacillus sp. MUM 13]OIK11267.1 bifunctional metallophosphatase/5'-nucleotidase [Bacillus sp. MUM 13]